MQLGLCMIVKDEENTIEGCLEGVVDVFDEVVIVDSGSSDRTREILRDRFSIKPIVVHRSGRYASNQAARNLGFSKARSPWIFVLDADERVDRQALETFRTRQVPDSVAGFFFRWDSYVGDDVIEDYKLSAFRNGIRSCGLAHENVTQHIRASGQRADWCEDLRIVHFPETGKATRKLDIYEQRLRKCIRDEPSWIRYYWFLGYMLLRGGRVEEALPHLSAAAHSNSLRFPVESLNARMVLAEVHVRSTKPDCTRRALCEGLELLERVRDDFEVAVNFRMETWLRRSLEACEAGELDLIRAYPFAY